MMLRAVTAILVVLLGTMVGAQAKAPPQPPPLPTYQANVEPLVTDALARAREENRRVLVQWGSNADLASKDFMEVAVRNREVARTLLYEYEVVRAEFKGNESVAARYQAQAAGSGLPHLTVLDKDGATIANRPAATFKAEGEATGAASYDAKRLNEFLAGLKANYDDANKLFTEALGQAKKEQKTLFLWFSAPW